MRILGLAKKWPKLREDKFSTFRFTRKDRDWAEGELVQVVYKPRSREREILGIAMIENKELRRIDSFRGVPTIPYRGFITAEEAQQDGFANGKEMLSWLENTYRNDERWLSAKPMNKLTLRWVERGQT